MATNNNNDDDDVEMRFLRTIPEDRSDLASSLALAPQSVGTRGGGGGSSVRGVDAGREGSDLSTAGAVLAPEDRRGTTDAAAAAEREQHAQRRRRRRGPKWPRELTCVALSVLVAVAGAVVAVVLVASSDRRDDDGSSASSPTMTPTVDPDVVADLDAVLRTLSTLRDVLPTRTTDGDTPDAEDVDPQVPSDDPRLLARDWMIHEDLLRDELLASDNAQAVLQRFVLVELYYATDGDGSWTTTATTTRRSQQDGTVADDDDDNNNNATATPFLTPEATECAWEGVDCEENEDSFFYVRTLDLDGRNLTGTLPASLYVLQELGEISMLQNALSGTIPDLWFSNDTTHMPALFKLDLEYNRLTGTIPRRLWSHGNMRFVYLDNNQLSGPVFEGNKEDDRVSAFLEEVWLYNNTLTGPLPSWLFHHELLTVFWADGNQFSDSLPTPGPASSLEWLTLSFNALTGPVLSGHFQGPKLETIGLNDNELSGPLPGTSRDVSPLINVWLHNNSLSGDIPFNFGLSWTRLRNLYLSGNPELTGEITADQCNVWDTRDNPVENVQVDCPPVVCFGACCNDDACYEV